MAGSLLDAQALLRSLRVLASEPSTIVARRSQIDPQRARLLPAGLLILAAMAQRLGERRAEATVDRLDGVGHYPMVEAPERFNAALAKALASP